MVFVTGRLAQRRPIGTRQGWLFPLPGLGEGSRGDTRPLALRKEDKGFESKPLKCSTELGLGVCIIESKPLRSSTRLDPKSLLKQTHDQLKYELYCVETPFSLFKQFRSSDCGNGATTRQKRSQRQTCGLTEGEGSRTHSVDDTNDRICLPFVSHLPPCPNTIGEPVQRVLIVESCLLNELDIPAQPALTGARTVAPNFVSSNAVIASAACNSYSPFCESRQQLAIYFDTLFLLSSSKKDCMSRALVESLTLHNPPVNAVAPYARTAYGKPRRSLPMDSPPVPDTHASNTTREVSGYISARSRLPKGS